MTSWVLGIGGSHNGSFCLLEDGEIRVAIQEERLTGVKRARVCGGRHNLGLRYCLDAAGIEPSDLSMVVLASQRSSRALENDIGLNPNLRNVLNVPRRVVTHHLAHAASAYATSGYGRAAVLVVDGLGSPVEDLTNVDESVLSGPAENSYEHLSLFSAHHEDITLLDSHMVPRWLEREEAGMWRFFTLGGMYAAVAEQIFGDMNDAGKVMGLAPYGEPTIPTEEFFYFDGDRLCFSNLVQRRYQGLKPWPDNQELYCELAASVQRTLEIALLRTAKRLRDITSETDLCFAGGVALNSVANERLCREAGFENVFIIPAADDSGVSVGAAYLGHWALNGFSRQEQVRTDAHGNSARLVDTQEESFVMRNVVASAHGDIIEETTDRLLNGQVGGWFQGGSELGPRSLGHRSIICSPINHDAKDVLNAQVKYRESFRPFAPSILAEHATEWFDFGTGSSDSPFMLRVVPFQDHRCDQVPAVVHVDRTGRVQTLTLQDNSRFYDLVACFHGKTGVPMLLNTSLNIRGEPIAETPMDALWCLLGTGLDFCVINDQLFTKHDNFHSILDYVVAVIADDYSLRLDIVDHALQTVVQREDALIMRTSTPWGHADIVVPLRLLPILSAIDGRRTGYDMTHALAERPSQTSLVRDLLLLRRMHVIEFMEPHVPVN